MTYTIWFQVNTDLYKFYMSTKVASLLQPPAFAAYIVTKTPHSIRNTNYKYIDELNRHPQIQI